MGISVLLVAPDVKLNKEGYYLINKVKCLASNGMSVSVITSGGEGAQLLSDANINYYELKWINTEPDKLSISYSKEEINIIKGIVENDKIDIIESIGLYPSLYVYYFSKIQDTPFFINVLREEDFTNDNGKYTGFLKEMNKRELYYTIDPNVSETIERVNNISLNGCRLVNDRLFGNEKLIDDFKLSSNWNSEYNRVIHNYKANNDYFLEYDCLEKLRIKNAIDLGFMYDMDKEIVLFGAGSYGENVYRTLHKVNKEAAYFCDNDPNKWGTYFCDTKVLSVDELLEIKDKVNVLITSIFYEEIREQLVALGFTNIFYGDILLGNIYVNNVQRVLNILEDYHSKQTFISLILHRIFKYDFDLVKKVVSAIKTEKMYFDSNLMKVDNDEVLIDGGAFHGSAIKMFLKKTGGKFEKIIAFEPNEKEMNHLVKVMKESNLYEKIKLEQAGLYDRTGEISYMKSEGGSSKITDFGEETISICSIDEYMKGEPVTFIKMDIEGSELKALIGAQNTIKKYKPKLAICIYHKIEDFWEIPLYIKSLNPDYKIHVRHYNKENVWDTICYALP